MTRYGLAVALTLTLAGCADAPAPGQPAVSDLAEAKAPAGTGHVRGYVHGAEGQTYPAAFASVTVGGRTVAVANPGDPVVKHEQDDGRTVSVYHDFEDGEGPVLAERRLRQFPVAGDTPLERRYVYLRRGEFFLEGLLSGPQTLTVTYEDATIAHALTVAAGKTLTAPAIALPIYAPVTHEDGSQPRVVDLGSIPADPIRVIIDRPAEQPATARFETSGEAALTLKAPPGSAGATVEKVRLHYTWQAGGAAQASPELEVAVAAVTVSAGGRAVYGPAATVGVPLPTAPLARVPAGATAIKAVVHFLGPDGHLLETRTLDALKAEIPLTEAPKEEGPK